MHGTVPAVQAKSLCSAAINPESQSVPPVDSTTVDITEAERATEADVSIPHPVHTHVDVSQFQGSRIFLDICSGAGYPLSSAMSHCGCVCFPSDKLIDAQIDLLGKNFFEPLLCICSSGGVGYAAASPNCGE